MIRRLIFLIVLIAIVAFGWFYCVNKNSDTSKLPKQQPLEVSQHSEAFHNSFGNMMTAYYEMTEAFVNWDSSSIDRTSENFKTFLDDLNMDDLKNDSLIYETALVYREKSKNQIGKLISTSSIAEKRSSLNLLTPVIYDLLRTVKYDQDKVYLIECPMAFNDVESGFWLNKTNDVRNPYLGTSHPKYKKAMLKCGLAKDTLNF